MGARRYFAAGDYLTREPANCSFQLLIESPFEKPGWQARTSSPQGTTFPGSSIRFEDRFYEVVLIQNNASAFSYYLNPWEERFPIRVQFSYSPQECVKALKSRKSDKRFQRTRFSALALAPFLGLLPAQEQTKIQNKFGIPATRMTLLSALLTLMPGGAGIIFLFVSVIAGGFGASGVEFHRIYLVGCYLFVESLLRIYSALKLEEPMGDIFVWLPVSIITDVFGQKKRAQDSTQAPEEDQITFVEGKEHNLEVISSYPKPHWNSMTAIQFEEKWYSLHESETITQGGKNRYRFLLKNAPEIYCFRSTTIYTRDEVSKILRDKRRSELRTWVQTFALFWGLLTGPDQERLAELYDFDALKFTIITIIFLAIFGVFNFIASIANLSAGRATRLDHLLLIPALYFVGESFLRWKSWREGRPAGSVLGIFIRPFASRLLE